MYAEQCCNSAFKAAAKMRKTHRHKIGSCKVSDDSRGGADAHVTDEGEHPPAGEKPPSEQDCFGLTAF